MEQMMAKYGEAEVLRRAVSGMLPKSRLRDICLARLRAFEGPGHPYRKNIVRLHDVTERASGPKILDAWKEREKGSRVVMAGQQ